MTSISPLGAWRRPRLRPRGRGRARLDGPRDWQRQPATEDGEARRRDAQRRRVRRSSRRSTRRSIGEFKPEQTAVTDQLRGWRLGQGPTDFANQVVDFAGTDAPYSRGPRRSRAPFLYFPTVVAPITVSYNLSGVTKLQLSADTIAKIFQGQITKWDDAAIKTDNPKAKLPSTDDHGGAPLRRLGHHAELHQLPVKAAPTTWTLGTGSTVAWPASTQGGQRQRRCRQLVKATDGAIGYVDFSDAKAGGLTFASIKNAAGKYVAPTLDGGVGGARRARRSTPTSPTTRSTRPVPTAYPITSPTWIIVYTTQTDAKKGAALEGVPQLHLRHQGQELAADGRLRAAAEGLAEAGQGAAQADHRPRVDCSVQRGAGRAPARPAPVR